MGTYDELDASEIEASAPDVCRPDCETKQMHGFEGAGLPACRELGSGLPLRYCAALDAAGTCQEVA